jgi:hypothetical protein
MKQAFLVVAIMLMAGVACAEPFLVCDPQAGVETYTVYKDAVVFAADVPAVPDGSLRLDLVGVTPGVYAWTATAKNVWATSELSEVYLSPGQPSAPQNLRLE